MKQSQKQGKKNKIGATGEKIAENYLRKQGFRILETNYLKKWGEIDIVVRKGSRTHFIEVKTVSHETKKELMTAVSHGTWRPEENVTAKKLLKMNRAIESWLSEQTEPFTQWQIDIAAVRVVPHEKYATIKYMENIIL